MANWTPKLNNQSFVESELAKAFKMWSDYSRLEFVKSDDYYGSDIVIAFGRYSHGDSYPFDGPGHNEAKAKIQKRMFNLSNIVRASSTRIRSILGSGTRF